MKQIIFIWLLFLASSSFGQVIYKSSNNDAFKSLVTNGVYYIKTGNELKDSTMEASLNAYWKVSPVHILEQSEAKNIKKTDVLVTFSTVGGTQSLAFIEYYEISKTNERSQYAAVGYILLSGINQSAYNENVLGFIPTCVAIFNDVAACIQKYNLKGKYIKLSKGITKSLCSENTSGKIVAKPLLIVGDTKDWLDLSDFDKNGVKYKLVSTEEYLELLESDEKDQYSLLYFGIEYIYTEVSIIDLETNKLLYSKRTTDNNPKVKKISFKEITK